MEEFGLNFLPQYDDNGNLLTARLPLPTPTALAGAAPHRSNPHSSTGKPPSAETDSVPTLDDQ